MNRTRHVASLSASLRVSLIACLWASLLSGCVTNGVQIAGPTTTRPEPRLAAPVANGAIYQASSYRPLFEDRRARFPGDTLLVSISEKMSASTKTGNNNSRTASAEASIPTVQGVPGKFMQGTAVSGTIATKSEDKDAATNDNLFTGSIAVTVIEVLPNGNLAVAGEKQIGVNGETDTIRFSGVVNPLTIQPGNIVSSVQVADARIESISRSSVDPARVAGFLGRFFMSFIPFR